MAQQDLIQQVFTTCKRAWRTRYSVCLSRRHGRRATRMYIQLSCKSTFSSATFQASNHNHESQHRLTVFFRRLPNNNATGCTGNPWSDWVTDDIAASSGVCYNNQAYYLFNVAGGPCNDLKERETGPGILPCPDKVLSELPGVGTMDGTAWGGVTRDDLAIRYVLSLSLRSPLPITPHPRLLPHGAQKYLNTPYILFLSAPHPHTKTPHPTHPAILQLNYKTAPYKPTASTTTPTAIKCPNSQT